IEVLPARDGAPEAWAGDERARTHLSIAHRKGRALAALADGPVGCDLEPLRDHRDVRPHVCWEAAAKATRRPLLGAERPEIDLDDRTFAATWPDGRRAHGEWWTEAGWAFAVARA
ncbi:MAG: hypothetical protein M3389_03420, partial [Actinomycetota bacterium]|nr:hypothetical protein [Actinomycetota bacterium]